MSQNTGIQIQVQHAEPLKVNGMSIPSLWVVASTSLNSNQMVRAEQAMARFRGFAIQNRGDNKDGQTFWRVGYVGRVDLDGFFAALEKLIL